MKSNVNADGDSEALPPTADRLKKDASPQDAPSSIPPSTPPPTTDIVCPICGASPKKRNGTKKTVAGVFQRYTCQNGHNFTDELHPIKK